MRRLRWLALLCLLGGVARGQSTSFQEWTDNQSGMGKFAAFNVTSYSATNLETGGAAFSVFGTGQIVNSPQAIATAWYVDPIHGSDAAACVASATACKTLQEINRRWRGGRIDLATTINILGPLPSTDTGSWNVTVASGVRVLLLASLGPVTGFGGASIDNTLYTGTVTGFSAATDSPSATDSELTDAGLPVSFTASGLLVSGVIFSDTTANLQFYVTKDLGSKTGRVTPPMLNSSPQLSSALTVGDTYKAYQEWTIYGQDWGAASSRVRYDSLNDLSGPLAQTIGSSSDHFRSWYLLGNSAKAISGQLVNCAVDITSGSGFLSAAYNSQGFTSISGGMLLGTGASELSIQGRFEISALIMQGSIMRPDEGFIAFNGGSIGVYDTSAPVFTLHGPSSLAFVQSSVGSGNGLCGKNNTSKLVTIESGPANVYYGYESHLPPFSAATTSDANPIQSGATSYPVSALPAVIDTAINFETNFPSTVFETGGPTRLTWGAVPSGDCVARDGGALIGVACGSGAGGSSGGVIVTGVAPIRVDAGAVGLKGAIISGSSSTTATQNLGSGGAGYLKDTVDAGVATVSTVAKIPATDVTGLPDASTQRLSAGPGITIDAGVIVNNLTTGTPDGGEANPVNGGTKASTNLDLHSTTNATKGVIDTDSQLQVPSGWNPAAPANSFVGHSSTGSGYDATNNQWDISLLGTTTIQVTSSALYVDPLAMYIGGGAAGMQFVNGNLIVLFVEDSLRSFAFASATRPTNATTNFVELPGMHGAPTGTPGTIESGQLPQILDDTNDRWDIYNAGAWGTWGQLDNFTGIVKSAATTGIHTQAVAGTDYQTPLVACTDYVSVSCQGGTSDIGGTNADVTVTALESGALARGDVAFSTFPAPSNSTTGTIDCYDDSATGILTCINHSSATSNVVVPGNCATSNWVTGYASTGVRTCVQPTYTDIGGTPPATTCSGLPAFTGDSTKASGSCATVNVALTESGGADLSLGAIPDRSPNFSVMVRNPGTTIITGQPATALSVGVAVVSLPFQEFFSAGTIGNGYLSTGNNSGTVTAGGNPVEYPFGLAITSARLLVTVQTNGLTSAFCTGAQTLTIALTRNGGGAPPSTVAVTIPFSGSVPTTYDSGLVAEVGTGSTDTWGVFVTDNCGVVPGGLLSLTAVAEFAR